MNTTARTATAPFNPVYYTVAALAVISSWLLHELAHWATGTLLGYDMAMTLNTAYPLAGSFNTTTHEQLVSAAGPLLTLLEAIVVFFLVKKTRSRLLYVFLFTCFYSRFLALVISFLNPNDEARISKALGIGTFTLPLAVTALLFALLYRASVYGHFSKKFNAVTLALIILFSSLLILGDQYFKIRLV